MGTGRVTRRQVLAAGVGAVAAGCGGNPGGGPGAGAAPVPKADPDPSWVGKTVLPRAFSTKGMTVVTDGPKPAADPDGAPVETPVGLDAASYDVKAEKGTRVEVLRTTGASCWVEKADLVPLADAVGHFTKGLKENEKDRFALLSRGWARHLLGDPAAAVKDFTAFLELPAAPAYTGAPERWEGLVARGLVHAEQGEFERAFRDLEEAVKGWPAVGLARLNRGYAYELNGNYPEAVADYEQAVKAGAGVLASNNQAWVLATCPDAKVRDGAKAVELARAVCEATRDREGMYLDTLAAALAEAGKFDDAARAQEKGLGDKGYAARYGEDGRKRLRLYKDKKPFRTEPVRK